MQLSDDKDQLENDFKERADELRSKYLENVSNIVLKSEEEFEEVKASINGFNEKVRRHIFSCFCWLFLFYFMYVRFFCHFLWSKIQCVNK